MITQAWLQEHIWPRFSRVLASNKGIYLANHSLGRPLDQTAMDVQEGLDYWYERLDGVWDEDAWPAEIVRFRKNIARLIGAPDHLNVIPKTSAGQGLRAVLNSFEGVPRVVATRGEFDSVDLILKAYAAKGRAEVRWVEPNPTEPVTFDADSVLAEVAHGTDLLVISYVFFSTGQIMPDLGRVIREAQSQGALVLIDAYHAAGVLPFSFQDLGADFMIGGSYKYLRGGPGACWLAISERNRESRRTLDTGWFAKKNPFDYSRPDPPVFGEAWLESTPPALTMFQTRAGLELILELGVDNLRAYNLRQQDVLRAAFRHHGVRFLDTDPTQFGAFTLVADPDASGFARALAAEGVNTDARGATVRFGPDILNTDEELEEAARITAKIQNQ
jgi:kynureninase